MNARILPGMVPVRSLLVSAFAGPLLGGCVVVPVVRDVYDVDCQVYSRHMELQAVQLGMLNGCGGQACEVVILANVAVTAASAIVSGSIVVVGNVAYWAERRANCVPPPGSSSPA